MSNMAEFLLPTYNRFNINFDRGEGVYLFDKNGKRYLDMLSGIGVCGLGYSDKKLIDVLIEQANKVWHTSNLFHIESQEQLAYELVSALFPAKVFFSNSGAEANEAAIKFARLYGKERLNGAYKIITAERSFHGRTYATVSATGQDKVKDGFDPLCPGFENVEYNNFEELEKLLRKEDVVGVMLEPVQGEGGIIVGDSEYFNKVRTLTRQLDKLLILDEVQSGMGRTGDLFAFQGLGIQPDLFTSAKGLGNGLPIGATVIRKEIADIMSAGKHGSTFGGNHIVTAVATEVVKRIKSPDFLNEIRKKGKYFKELLLSLQKKYPDLIKEVRGKGLMIGIELSGECKDVVSSSLDKGLIVNCTASKVVRFLPPLIISEDELNYGVNILEEVILELKEKIS